MAASHCITEPLVQHFLDNHLSFIDAIATQQFRKASLHLTKLENYSNLFSDLYQQLDSSLRCAVYLASVRDASDWLTTLPCMVSLSMQPFRMPWL